MEATSIVAVLSTSHWQLQSAWNVASVTEEMSFYFYLTNQMPTGLARVIISAQIIPYGSHLHPDPTQVPVTKGT